MRVSLIILMIMIHSNLLLTVAPMEIDHIQTVSIPRHHLAVSYRSRLSAGNVLCGFCVPYKLQKLTIEFVVCTCITTDDYIMEVAILAELSVTYGEDSGCISTSHCMGPINPKFIIFKSKWLASCQSCVL